MLFLAFFITAQLASGLASPVARRADLTATARVASAASMVSSSAADDRVAGRVAEVVRSRIGAHAGVIVQSLEILNPSQAAIEDVRPVPNARLGSQMRFVALAKAVRGPARLVPVGEVVAHVTVTVEHAHTAHVITRGSTIVDGDLTTVQHDLRDVTLRAWSRPTAVVGARATRDLPANGCLDPGSVVLKPAVQTGQDVRAIARVAGVEASATLIAASSGAEGAVIRVVNRDSRRALRARVIAPGVVEILHD
jgi:flagella basal body P-ring formation protein FlgA